MCLSPRRWTPINFPVPDCDLDIPSDAGEEAPKDSTLADAGEKRAAEHWKGTSLAASMKEMPDGTYRLTYWQMKQTKRESEQKMRRATAKVRQRAVGGLSSLDGKKTLSQQILEGKCVGAAALLGSTREDWTEASEEDR